MLAGVHGGCVGVSLCAFAASQWMQLRDRQREEGKADKKENRGKEGKEDRGKEGKKR